MFEKEAIVEINCPNCGTEKYTIKYEKQGWKIVSCVNCAFKYTNPRLDNERIKKLYKENYFSNKKFGYSDYETEERLKKKNFTKWINNAKPFFENKQKHTALDVGSAAGYALDVYKTLGIKADGMELDDNYNKRCYEKGYAIYNNYFLEQDFDKKYDIISLFDVIEHLTELQETFEKLHSILHQSGILILVTPNYNSLQRRVFGPNWFQFKPIEHINYFTRKSLKKLALTHGFEMKIVKNAGQFVDAEFINNRIKNYNIKIINFFLKPVSWALKTYNHSIYLDSASIYCVFKKK